MILSVCAFPGNRTYDIGVAECHGQMCYTGFNLLILLKWQNDSLSKINVWWKQSYQVASSPFNETLELVCQVLTVLRAVVSDVVYCEEQRSMRNY